jgi:hypothetical protein
VVNKREASINAFVDSVAGELVMNSPLLENEDRIYGVVSSVVTLVMYGRGEKEAAEQIAPNGMECFGAGLFLAARHPALAGRLLEWAATEPDTGGRVYELYADILAALDERLNGVPA